MRWATYDRLINHLSNRFRNAATRVRRAVAAQIDIAGNAPATWGWLHLDAKRTTRRPVPGMLCRHRRPRAVIRSRSRRSIQDGLPGSSGDAGLSGAVKSAPSQLVQPDHPGLGAGVQRGELSRDVVGGGLVRHVDGDRGNFPAGRGGTRRPSPAPCSTGRSCQQLLTTMSGPTRWRRQQRGDAPGLVIFTAKQDVPRG